MNKIVILIIGWFFIGLELFDLLLPFLQGILIILIGYSFQSEKIKSFLNYLEGHYLRYYEKVVISY